MGIINVDINKGRADHEREQLRKAREGDEQAASDLLYFYADFGCVAAPDVQVEIEKGIRGVLKRSLEAAEVPDKDRVVWGPLIFFSKNFASKKRIAGRREASDENKAKTAAMLKRRALFNNGLTKEEMQYALTTVFKGLRFNKIIQGEQKIIPRESWPKTIGEAEKKLAEYVKYVFKLAPRDACIDYVRRSFPDIDWSATDADFPYPKRWYLPGNSTVG